MKRPPTPPPTCPFGVYGGYKGMVTGAPDGVGVLESRAFVVVGGLSSGVGRVDPAQVRYSTGANRNGSHQPKARLGLRVKV